MINTPDAAQPSPMLKSEEPTNHVVHPRGHLVETELIALDVLHYEARLVAAIGRQ